MKISILVCTHKLSFIPESKMLQPIFVGANNKDLELPSSFQRDDVGENISNLNGSYCELTGLYWGWKNLNADYIGLCHYRRFFSFKFSNKLKNLIKRLGYYIGHIYYATISKAKVGLFFPYQFEIRSESELSNNITKFEEDFSKLISKNPACELFALKPVNKGSLSNYFQFSSISGSHHLEIIRNLISDLYPDYLPYYNYTLLSNKLYYGNMIIMKKGIFDSYCDFLFTILRKYNDILIDKGFYSNINEKSLSRISGYMGELLTSTFISHYIGSNDKINYKLLYQMQYMPKNE